MVKRKAVGEDVLKKVQKLRRKSLGWETISDKLKKEGISFSPQTLKKRYDEYIAKQHVMTATLQEDKRRAKEATIDWNKQFLKRFEMLDNTINKQYKRIIDMMDSAYEHGRVKDYLKLFNQLLSVSKDIQEQMKLIKKQQSDIIINQKNAIYSPLQIMKVIGKELDEEIQKGELRVVDKKTGKVKNRFYVD